MLSFAIMAFGVFVIACMFAFGLRVYNRRFDYWCEQTSILLRRWLDNTNQQATLDLKYLGEAWDESLRRRNKFWELFGQVALSVVVSVILTVLLLTGAIQPDAGLPILSAVVAFVIGKGIDGQSRRVQGTSPAPPDSDSG